MVLKYHHKGRAGLMLRRKAVSAVETPRKKEISMNLQLLGQSKVVSQPSGIHHYRPSSDLVGGGCQYNHSRIVKFGSSIATSRLHSLVHTPRGQLLCFALIFIELSRSLWNNVSCPASRRF